MLLDKKEFTNRVKTGLIITLGIYLMHVALLNYICSNGWLFDNLPSVIGVPLISLIAFVICGLASAVLRRIPVIGRYLA